jgi:flagellar assembly factor FliW
MHIDETMIIHFPAGLLGFPEIKDYIIFDHDQDDVPFKWLQAVHEPGLAFLIMDPYLVQPDYTVALQSHDLYDLQAHDTTNLVLFVILTIPAGDPAGMTANLQGPVVVNSDKRWAKQLVLTNGLYHTQHPLFPPATATL